MKPGGHLPNYFWNGARPTLEDALQFWHGWLTDLAKRRGGFVVLFAPIHVRVEHH
jgi:hypothetical protein